MLTLIQMDANTMYEALKTDDMLEIRLIGTLDNVDKADRDTRMFLTDLKISEKARFRILLLMREALNNAIGAIAKGKQGSFRHVRYHLRIVENTLTMEVEDSGDGFDWKSKMETAWNTESCHGRGIPIMKKYAAHMHYNESGNLLKLVVDLRR